MYTNKTDTEIQVAAKNINPDDEFEKFLKNCARCENEKDKSLLRKAYNIASEAHHGLVLYSGAPYILHSIKVAEIVTNKIGLGVKSAVAALLHEVITMSEYTEEDIKNIFDEKIAYLVSGLTKIPENPEEKTSLQAENFRKLLLTLSDDIRVIFIKLADRLYNMRIIETLPRNLQLRLAGETLTMYSPLAQRLGMHSIKTEMEDIAFRTSHPKKYHEIKEKLKLSEKKRNHIINRFTIAISNQLKRQGIDFEIKGRTKSIFSIWNKMQKKGVSLEDIYDLLAVRIIFKTNENDISEDILSWKIFGLITRNYTPKTDRIRDWISQPKDNGYEALHVTILGPDNHWIEVQIRSERMNEIAELGYAAHWKYKGIDSKASGLDHWIQRTKTILENPDPANLRLLDEFKLNVFASEILVFTPKGEIHTLPKGASLLDFAFSVHTDLGLQCIGGQIGDKMVPVNYKLQSGDKVKVLTSSKAKPKNEWLDYLVTTAARENLSSYLNKHIFKVSDQGKRIFQNALEHYQITPTSLLFKNLTKYLNIHDKNDLYTKLGKGDISHEELQKALKKAKRKKLIKFWKLHSNGIKGKKQSSSNRDQENTNNTEKYEVAKCCNPIPGDDVIGFRGANNLIIVHKAECPNALNLSATHAEQIVDVKWHHQQLMSFLAVIKLQGEDRVGIVNKITATISRDWHVNMKSIQFDSEDSIFSGSIELYVHNVEDLNNLILQLTKIEGIKSVQREEDIYSELQDTD